MRKSDRWPDVYIIGALKAGTTSLHAFLRRHESVFVPERKYLRYFAREVHPTFCWLENEQAHRELYLRSFAGAKVEQVLVDCENMTILNAVAAGRIAAVRPDARIVVILRNPVERAWSHYLSNYERGTDRRNPTEALLGEPRSFPGMKVPDRYIEAGLYHQLLSRYTAYFPRGNMLLVDFDELTKNPSSVQRRLCEFIGVPSKATKELGDIRENETLVARNSLIRSVHRFRHGRTGAMVRRILPRRFLNAVQPYMFITTKEQAMPAVLRRELISRFREDAERLEREFNFTIEHWRTKWAEVPMEQEPRSKARMRVTVGAAVRFIGRYSRRIFFKLRYIRNYIPSNAETIMVAKLRETFKRLTWGGVGSVPSEQAWLNNALRLRELVSTKDPRNFLAWDVVRKTMVFENKAFIATELAHLKSDPAWSEIWKPALSESLGIRGMRNPFYPRSGGNSIHHAYHFWKMEQALATRVTDYDCIFEFGGGYGNMARLAYALGFSGEYIIYDLACFNALQCYYLESLGITAAMEPSSLERGTVSCLSSLANLRDLLRSLGPRRALFVGTWSISETSLHARSQILPITERSFDILIAYQTQFKEVDNHAFFEKWCAEHKADLEWKTERIDHMEGDFYLFGKHRRS